MVKDEFIPLTSSSIRVSREGIKLTDDLVIGFEQLNSESFVAFTAACFVKKIMFIAAEKGVVINELMVNVKAFADIEDVAEGTNRVARIDLLVKSPTKIPDSVIDEARKECTAYATLSRCVEFNVEFEIDEG